MNLLKTSALVKKYDLFAKKSFGQNFIFDSNLTDKIAKCAGSLKDFEVLEIGPGPGSLTRSILGHHPKKLTVIEMDPRFLPLLEEIKSFHPTLEIINADALKIDEAKIIQQKPFKIIANLPYNVGTELVFKWIENYGADIDLMILMLQKEVVERIVAKPGSKKYGRLAVMVNFLCDTEYLFDVSPNSFTPPPKVTSSLVKIIPKKQKIKKEQIKKLSQVVAAAFNQRRKKIRSSLKSIAPNIEEIFTKLNIDQNLRAEQLTIEQFLAIANSI
jgi:16S rRNA (adenine1518-N6/adenine1519-N6)-dimethyltransferase